MPFSTNSPAFHFLFLLIFFLAFFPTLFQKLLWLPLSPLLPSPTPKPSPVLCAHPNICASPSKMSWTQKTLTLPAKPRGSHLITSTITSSLPELSTYKVGILHLFLQHTSCALSLNENFDEDVRADMTDALDRIVVEDKKGEGIYRHDAEGSDDMPAHIKSALVGASVSIPIREGRLALGTWQGVWFLEFRGGRMERRVVATIQGEKA